MSSAAGLFSNRKEKEEVYHGLLFFKKRTMSFAGTTILLKNIAKFEQYNVKNTLRVPTIALIVACILAVVGLTQAPYGLLITLVAAPVILMGILERRRPRIYGLTIELNSASRQSFLSKDEKGINELFSAISRFVENEEDVVVQASFTTNQVKVDVVQGDKNEFHHSTIYQDSVPAK